MRHLFSWVADSEHLTECLGFAGRMAQIEVAKVCSDSFSSELKTALGLRSVSPPGLTRQALLLVKFHRTCSEVRSALH